MTGTDLYKRTHKSVPVIFVPPCISSVCLKIHYANTNLYGRRLCTCLQVLCVHSELPINESLNVCLKKEMLTILLLQFLSFLLDLLRA